MSALSTGPMRADQVLRFSHLDAQALKPYAWSLMLPLVVVIPLAWAEPVVLVSVAPVLVAMMASSYVFSLDESAGLGLLHVLLPGAKQSAVFGRYVVMAIVLGVSLLTSVILALAAIASGRGAAQGLLAVVVSGACTALMFLSVQMPLFFRFGYLRARFWGYAAFLVLTGAFGGVIMLFPSFALFMFTGIKPLFLLCGALAVFCGSALVSARVVAAREV